MAQQQTGKQRLIYSVLKFLDEEIRAESANTERRESLEVAVQCLETAFEVSIANTQNEATFGPSVDLLQVVNQTNTNTTGGASATGHGTGIPSWYGGHEQPTMSVPLTDDMRQQADKLKNEGNEFVKQEKYKEALEAYNAAIKIDGNNAIYYCNRAAAHNKLNNNDQALSDCYRSIEIDPNYSKAYGRLGVIYLSLDKVHEALEAYKKAQALEPTNENYKQSIRICEERLNSTGGASASASATPPNMSAMFGNLMSGMGGMSGMAGAAGGPDMMSFFNNPSLMNMAMQFVQNPQVQGLMANLVTNLGSQEGGDVGIETLLQTGQRMASELSASNPDLIESIRRNAGRGASGGNNNSSTQNDSSNNPDQNKPNAS